MWSYYLQLSFANDVVNIYQIEIKAPLSPYLFFVMFPLLVAPFVPFIPLAVAGVGAALGSVFVKHVGDDQFKEEFGFSPDEY